MNIPIYQVDAFTDRVFGGNPAAVCPLDSWPDDALLANIAAENNLSETAFFVNRGDHFEIRWFTPTVEVDLCGHATLAASHVIFHDLAYPGHEIRFLSSAHGYLYVTREKELLVLNFPATMPVKAGPEEVVVRALRQKPLELWKSRDIMALYSKEEEVRNLHPDFPLLKQLGIPGIIVTAPGTGVDFVSRYFAPGVGIDEDPVTGSAHTTLIPYWAQRLGKTKLRALQVSKRQGELFCEMKDERVLIGGKALTYMKGKIELA